MIGTCETTITGTHQATADRALISGILQVQAIPSNTHTL
jgi:hypothetical protein